jgi:hypothetical protein
MPLLKGKEVAMTQLGESVAIGLLLLPEKAESSTHSCKWRCALDQKGDHVEKWHHQKPEYPNGGNSERSDGYSKAWKSAGRVPWTEGDGIDPRRWPDAYHIKRHSSATTYVHPEYATEGHHLISCDLFKEDNYPALVHNALLMGYDINCNENGWHFPAHIVDIICHNHQHHASQHSWSEPAPLKYDLDELVAPLLANLEEQILTNCRNDANGELRSQAAVIKLLNSLSKVIKGKLVRWEWFLTKLARMKLGMIRDYGIKVDHIKYHGNGFVVVHEKGAQLTMLEGNLSLGGFPHFSHYVAAAVDDLDKGMNPNIPFTWWLSRRMYRERVGQADGPNSPVARMSATSGVMS